MVCACHILHLGVRTSLSVCACISSLLYIYMYIYLYIIYVYNINIYMYIHMYPSIHAQTYSDFCAFVSSCTCDFRRMAWYRDSIRNCGSSNHSISVILLDENEE